MAVRHYPRRYEIQVVCATIARVERYFWLLEDGLSTIKVWRTECELILKKVQFVPLSLDAQFRQ